MPNRNTERKPQEDQKAEEVERILADYSRASVSLAQLLQDKPSLSDLQRLSIENHMAIVQLHYTYWVRQASKVLRSV
jgi:hypothetical protein